jgi:hypothetical protein
MGDLASVAMKIQKAFKLKKQKEVGKVILEKKREELKED